MHCNLRLPDAAPVLIHFDYDAHAKFEVTQPIRCCLTVFLLLIHYATLWSWRLTLCPWPLISNICSVSPVLWWNSAPDFNEIEQSTAELLRFVWPYDLEHVSCVKLCCHFHRASTQLKCNFFAGDTTCHAVTLTFDTLTFNICCTWSVTWSKSAWNLSKSEQSSAELLII